MKKEIYVNRINECLWILKDSVIIILAMCGFVSCTNQTHENNSVSDLVDYFGAEHRFSKLPLDIRVNIMDAFMREYAQLNLSSVDKEKFNLDDFEISIWKKLSRDGHMKLIDEKDWTTFFNSYYYGMCMEMYEILSNKPNDIPNYYKIGFSNMVHCAHLNDSIFLFPTTLIRNYNPQE